MITSLDEYEKALVVFALRQLSTSKLKEAIACYNAGHSKAGEDASGTADASTKLANRIQDEN